MENEFSLSLMVPLGGPLGGGTVVVGNLCVTSFVVAKWNGRTVSSNITVNPG